MCSGCQGHRDREGSGCPVCQGWGEVIRLADGRLVAGSGGPRCIPCPHCRPHGLNGRRPPREAAA